MEAFSFSNFRLLPQVAVKAQFQRSTNFYLQDQNKKVLIRSFQFVLINYLFLFTVTVSEFVILNNETKVKNGCF